MEDLLVLKILDNVPYADIRAEDINCKDQDGNTIADLSSPLLPSISEVLIGPTHRPEVSIRINVLFDTGNDITIVNPRIIEDLDSLLEEGKDLVHVTRQIKYYENGSFEKAYSLVLILPGGYQYSTDIGFVAAQTDFEAWDVWLGQDFFERFVVTFDGPAQLLSVADLRQTRDV